MWFLLEKPLRALGKIPAMWNCSLIARQFRRRESKRVDSSCGRSARAEMPLRRRLGTKGIELNYDRFASRGDFVPSTSEGYVGSDVNQGTELEKSRKPRID
jgi:hypothetical protein